MLNDSGTATDGTTIAIGRMRDAQWANATRDTIHLRKVSEHGLLD
jgi:hypothetical protein